MCNEIVAKKIHSQVEDQTKVGFGGAYWPETSSNSKPTRQKQIKRNWKFGRLGCVYMIHFGETDSSTVSMSNKALQNKTYCANEYDAQYTKGLSYVQFDVQRKS
jgi:hypothetical protein